jgi:hypothetical protein
MIIVFELAGVTDVTGAWEGQDADLEECASMLSVSLGQEGCLARNQRLCHNGRHKIASPTSAMLDGA